MTVTRSVIVRNGLEGDIGGGIGNSGTLTVTDSLIAFNAAKYGGGIYNGSFSGQSPAVALIERTRIIENSADEKGGGIHNDQQQVIVRDSVISKNRQENTSLESGGGVFNEGWMELSDSIISENTANTYGGGIATYSSMAITRTQIISNTAGLGAGGMLVAPISLDPSMKVTLSESVVGQNTSQHGGGIVTTGLIEIRDSAIINNTAAQNAGGIAVSSWNNAPNAIINSTISGNRAGIDGGGIEVYTATLLLKSTTITNNQADSDANSSGSGGGLWSTAGSTINIHNSILWGNQQGSQANDCVGPLHSQGYNLLAANTGCTAVSSDIVGQPAQLGPLAANGGPTPTHALLPSSPAIDAGDPLGCRDSYGALLLTDQRGVPRHTGPACDIGAFEVAPDSLTVVLHMQQPVSWPGLATTATVLVWSPQGVPTGTVVLKNGSTVLGNATLLDGKCTFTLPALELGEYTLVAEYQGGGSFEAANSAALTYSVRMPVFLPVTVRE